MTSTYRLSRTLWIILALLTVAAAGIGVFAPRIYDGVITPVIEPGVFTQDLVSLIGAAVLLLLAVTSGETQLRRQAIAHGIIGFLFYAFSIYAIERVYTDLYPLYLIIVGLSLFTIVQSVAAARSEQTVEVSVPAYARVAASVFAILIAIMFNFIWISQLLPLIAERNRIDFLYSIYVIDLSFVMPAFVVAAVSALRQRQLGLLGLPSLFVLGAGILSPLAIAELIKPSRYGLAFIAGEFWLYLILTVLFVLFAGAYLALTRESTRGS